MLLPGASEDGPSGLADMLHQFLEQVIDEDPNKASQARRISGNMLFRAAEDTSICVRLSFAGEGIEVADHDGTHNRWPALTADFLTTAHMTTGEESPLALVRQKKMQVKCSLWHGLFLLRVLRLMRVPKEGEEQSSRAWPWMLPLVGAIVVALVVYFAWMN